MPIPVKWLSEFGCTGVRFTPHRNNGWFFGTGHFLISTSDVIPKDRRDKYWQIMVEGHRHVHRKGPRYRIRAFWYSLIYGILYPVCVDYRIPPKCTCGRDLNRRIWTSCKSCYAHHKHMKIGSLTSEVPYLNIEHDKTK